ncbi:cupin domain-containing protein [Haliangium ochraceum]|uniref:Cupin 2 conserved barrel domain protein n=1 Tax=Haliangium ochraceum (strain DSM 14365 / JCM 11303 / SMP-2) TaxID=502025 RepID=D0LUW5_HALO1|nr:cupin domain-containing protein [Haliangium ochraceum]ACY14005.1 Cupin 2 conserved barrel domain protein [Haliangium ochraceum DSM 14365]
MPPAVLNLTEKLTLVSAPWSPRVVAELNDYQIKLVKLNGEFVWHKHANTDELFLVLAGAMFIEFRDGVVQLGTGEMCVVPRGVEHRPYAEDECHALLLEPRGVVNTGDAGSEGDALRADGDIWI